MEAKSTSEVQIEDVETFNNKVYNQVVGSTKLINDSEVVLVPTPSNDPNGKGFDCTHSSSAVLTPIIQTL
ncbi:unnamed protein product [Aspergillus oryzae var. brunneus]|uniref:Unnamed protein product n=1 Tax=Aspergillus oryzae var. brunneus TaxID=332754 RepID=A0ABQ6KFM8_ASPOZ|nr:unnamed protein product [Aspergillus oryzae]GMG40819.1 unnamed protein product [Aspergillus oryzae var. brunneus]